MNRRTFMTITAAAVAAARAGLLPEAAHAQDLEFIAALERAQRDRPASLASSARIAPPAEPGIPLVVRGRAVAEDGKTPVAGAVIFAYQTDKDGHYDRPGSAAHFNIILADGRRYWADGLEFDDDPLLPAQLRSESQQRAPFGAVGHVRKEGGTQLVEFNFRLYAKNKF
jgi:hypothetical protein